MAESSAEETPFTGGTLLFSGATDWAMVNRAGGKGSKKNPAVRSDMPLTALPCATANGRLRAYWPSCRYAASTESTVFVHAGRCRAGREVSQPRVANPPQSAGGEQPLRRHPAHPAHANPRTSPALSVTSTRISSCVLLKLFATIILCHAVSAKPGVSLLSCRT